MNLSDYYNKKTSKKWLKFLFNLKIFLGAISGAAYVQDEPKLAFWILAAGGLIDLIINTINNDSDNNSDQSSIPPTARKATLIILMISFCFMFLTGCRPFRQSVSLDRIDSTWVNYKLSKLSVPGGVAQANPLNIDSLKKLLQLGIDSSGKTIYKEMQPIYINDTTGSAVLKIWSDKFGNLYTECVAKDKLIDVLTAEVHKLRTENRNTTQVEVKTPKSNIIVITVLATLLLISLLINLFKR